MANQNIWYICWFFFFFNLSSFFVVKSKILYVVCSNASKHSVFRPQAALLLTFSFSRLLSYKSQSLMFLPFTSQESPSLMLLFTISLSLCFSTSTASPWFSVGKASYLLLSVCMFWSELHPLSTVIFLGYLLNCIFQSEKSSVSSHDVRKFTPCSLIQEVL